MPIFLLFDNEQKHKDKSLRKFKNNIGINSEINGSEHIKGNLYLLTNPLKKGLEESEIEDLFDDVILNKKLNNKSFSRDDKFDNIKFYGKKIFADYIMKNYKTINFDYFRPLLDEICNVINI